MDQSMTTDNSAFADNIGDNFDDNVVEISFLSRAENVSLARLAASAMAAERDITIAELDEIKVAVSEAVSNAVIHGYGNRDTEKVYLKLRLSPASLTIEVTDYGIGIVDIEEAMRPTYSAEEGRMGLGFSFMESFMDQLQVISTPGVGTTVITVKNLPPLAPTLTEE